VIAMKAPEQVQVSSLADYLSVMTRAVFQTGLSWRVIDAKWPGFEEAFFGFDPQRVAALTQADVDRLSEDTRIVRNRRKIEATIDNANALLALDREPGGFGAWLGSHSGFEQTVKELRAHFRYLGETGAYYFLYVVGEPVPAHEDWMAAHPPKARPPKGR
jgi:3-methyladenine DNA glycosylase Tag